MNCPLLFMVLFREPLQAACHLKGEFRVEGPMKQQRYLSEHFGTRGRLY
jgi:hypothetical protein